MSIEFTALRPFNLSRNGIHSDYIQKGDVISDIPPDLVDGLEDEGYIREGRHKVTSMPAPENKDMGPAPETTGPVDDDEDEDTDEIVIPENWRELGWNELRSLAASVSDSPIGSKDAAHDAIEAYLDANPDD